MNPTIAFLLGGLLLLVWAALLQAFKQLCLDKIKRSFLEIFAGNDVCLWNIALALCGF